MESGPQFTLQSYILLIGQKKDTNIDWDNITEADSERLAVLSFSIIFSFASLVKTAYQVESHSFIAETFAASGGD